MNARWFVPAWLTDTLYSVVIQIFIMDLVMYDAHIIHYFINPLQSVALDPDHLVIHCTIQATLLHPTIITPVEALNVWRYGQLFEGVVGYMPNDVPLVPHCHHFS